jgi:hypothetical protein
MTVDVYFHERCSKCGDIRSALKRHGIEYKGHYFPPENPDLHVPPKAHHPDTPADFAPVLIHETTPSTAVIGYDEILEWIDESLE